MLQKRNSEEKIWNISAHIILIIFSLIIVLPLLWIVRTSFATDVIAYEIPPRLIFLPTLKNYILLFKENNFALKFYNSFTVAFFLHLYLYLLLHWEGMPLQDTSQGGKFQDFL